MTALGLAAGLVPPAVNTLVTGAVGTAERGSVTSLYGSVRFFGTAIGPPAAEEINVLWHRTITLQK